MKNFMKFSLLVGMIAVLFLSACKKDKPEPSPEPPATNNFEVFKNYLVDNHLDISDVLDGWIISAEAVHTTPDDFYVIDIRSAEDFQKGHIPGAVNSTLKDILTAATLSGGKTIVVACYTGQTAGHAVLALRLSGYPGAKVLKWGMSSWNQATAASWLNNTSDIGDGHAGWTFPAAPATNIEFGDPTLETTAENGADILKERVEVLLNGGMNKIAAAEVLAAPGDYFVNNFWAEADNTHYGHVSGAFRIQPLTLAGGEYKYLDQSATIVSYCWTGQTSSMLTAYLKVLGYNVKSLLFGANGMIHSSLESHKFTAAEVMDYDLETSEAPHEGFADLKAYLIDNNLDVSQVLDGWITSAQVLYDNMEDGDDANDFYVIDLRSAEDYDAGHIEGAVNTTLGGVLATAGGADGHPIIVACYTGQTAGHAVLALRLSGFADAKVLKWGMSSWNAATAGSWLNNVSDVAVGHANWTFPAAPATNIEFGDPSISTTADGAELLAERVAVLLAGGMNKIAAADVLAAPGEYFVNNFWAEADNTHYGHIATAYRIQPLTLAGGEYKFLDPDATVVSYCWTGQTSSLLTAYLKVLGYNSKSLLFGANGMIHSSLETHKFTEAEVKDFPLVQ